MARKSNPEDTAGTRSKHRELTTALRQKIAQLHAGDRLPTQEELMRQFEVSDTTVLRSLSDLRREGLIVRRQGSGTFVADAPSPEDAGATRPKMVAVLASQNANLFFSEMIHAVEASLDANGLAPVLILDLNKTRRRERAAEFWRRGEIVGAIHIGSVALEEPDAMPTILIGESERDSEYCQVSLDNRAAGRLVGDYLWNLGHRRVAVITLEQAPHPAAFQGVDHLRVAGLRSLWEERGGSWSAAHELVHPVLLRSDDSRAVSTMRSYLEPLFLQKETAPTAIFATHDELATVAIRALEALGQRVPEDTSVMGFNDLGMLAAYFRPTLTTVRTPVATLGMLAVHQLMDLLRNPRQKPRSIRLPAEMIVRESTAPPLVEVASPKGNKLC
jgi:LacI family transcriptional regulator, repressor for deo operon, udp, cdd, tsx, nupC, and nupG